MPAANTSHLIREHCQANHSAILNLGSVLVRMQARTHIDVVEMPLPRKTLPPPSPDTENPPALWSPLERLPVRLCPSLVPGTKAGEMLSMRQPPILRRPPPAAVTLLARISSRMDFFQGASLKYMKPCEFTIDSGRQPPQSWRLPHPEHLPGLRSETIWEVHMGG
jgi:hypothetical protein